MTFPQSLLDEMADRDPADIDTIFIHHTVMVSTADVTDVDAVDKARGGFLCIGYNAYLKQVAPKEWVIQQARPLDKVPAAQYGYNTGGYAIAVGGNYTEGAASFVTPYDPRILEPIASQIHAVKRKCPNLKYLAGHRDVATIMAAQGLNPGDYSTNCPGDNLYPHLHDLRLLTGLKQHPNT